MRILVLSDIHGNAIALRHLLDQCARVPHLAAPDAVRVLGDLSGYFSDPLAVWQMALALDPDLRLGNHDIYLRDRLLHNRQGVGASESEAVAWTIMLHDQMIRAAMIASTDDDTLPHGSQTAVRIVAHLGRADVCAPHIDHLPGYTVITVHGAPFIDAGFTTDDGYAMPYLNPSTQYSETQKIRRALTSALDLAGAHAERVLLVVGHTHMPLIATLDPDSDINVCWHGASWTHAGHDAPIDLDPLFARSHVVLINPGTVGYPRVSYDMAHHAHAALIDTTAHTLRMIAVDVSDAALDEVMRAMYAWDVPRYLHKIEPDLHRYYDNLHPTTRDADSRALYLGLANGDGVNLLRRWTDIIRPALINTYAQGVPPGDSDVYDYSASDFRVRGI